MGWLWSDPTPAGSPGDAYSKLDPALKEYLNKESPVKYEDPLPISHQAAKTASTSKDAAPNTFRSQLGIDTPGLSQQNQDSAPQHDRPEVPPESLYQDGRYAHVWKGYRSQHEIEQNGRSDQDKLADIVDAYNERKAQIGRAAIENCVLEQIAEKECFSNGGWHVMTTMCREESKAFNRCYNMQSRFLKALGYLSDRRTAEEEERIQMHADRLYQQMLERERTAAVAKKEGRQEPVFSPIFQSSVGGGGVAPAQADARTNYTAPSQLPEEQQRQLQERLAGKSQQEKELELELFKAEYKTKVGYALEIKDVLDEEKQNRAERRERGRETAGDTIKRMWGWDR